MITPWGLVGDDNEISVVTELSSCLETNPVALRMDVLCNQTSCPPGGVGVYNPGYWGMNIEEGQSYRVVFYLRSSGKLGLTASFVSENGTQVLDSQQVTAEAKTVENWTKMEVTLRARTSCTKSRLEFTTSQEGTIWLDQVSAMPNNTYLQGGF
ncbi:Alpha-L-arabinofuranosidase 2 [Bienertia sinuspersici]